MSIENTQQQLPAYANPLREITTLKSLTDYLEKLEKENTPKSFGDYFKKNEKVQKKGISKIIRESGLDRTYAYQIIQGRKTPGRDKALALCLAAGFSYAETQNALLYGSISVLNSSIKRDAILIFATNQGLKIDDIQELLYSHEEDLL